MRLHTVNQLVDLLAIAQSSEFNSTPIMNGNYVVLVPLLTFMPAGYTAKTTKTACSACMQGASEAGSFALCIEGETQMNVSNLTIKLFQLTCTILVIDVGAKTKPPRTILSISFFMSYVQVLRQKHIHRLRSYETSLKPYAHK